MYVSINICTFICPSHSSVVRLWIQMYDWLDIFSKMCKKKSQKHSLVYFTVPVALLFVLMDHYLVNSSPLEAEQWWMGCDERAGKLHWNRWATVWDYMPSAYKSRYRVKWSLQSGQWVQVQGGWFNKVDGEWTRLKKAHCSRNYVH